MTAHARTTNIDAPAEALRDMIADLTRTRSHRERLAQRPAAAGGPTTHFTRVPPLLLQLRYADWTGGDDRTGTGYESRPAASLEALDALIRIDLAAARWLRDLGIDDPVDTIDPETLLPIPATGTIRCVELLGAQLPNLNRCRRSRPVIDQQTRRVTCCTWHGVDHDVRRWWTQARITTGWDAAAWVPDNTCPSCGERRKMRVRLAERIGFCVECHETWTASGEPGYQVLADHIRLESELAATRVRLPVGPCSCPWPRPAEAVAEQYRLAGLCPRCGSASCRHAVRSPGRKTS